MRNSLLFILILTILLWSCGGKKNNTNNTKEGETEEAKPAGSQGLHGYLWYDSSRPPAGYGAGIGFYSAVWPLIEKPIANFQVGLPGTWISPDNSDNTDTPLCPIGTYARDNWPERGPTWSSVFQTVEGGLGYWNGNRFHYGPPKFSMNGTPNCYDHEIASPGWPFFYSSTPLPDNKLGIAQLSNRILVPPDGLTFQGNPNGQFLGYSWMALPFTDTREGPPPTGDHSWTLFLNASNLKGPVAYYIPETWSKISKDYTFDYGRGLDARPGVIGGGAMEFNTVPHFEGKDSQGTIYTKIPQLQFPVDGQGRTVLVQDVTYYSKEALYNAIKSWRNGGPACSGRFDESGFWKPTLSTDTPSFAQAGKKITGIDNIVNTKIFGSDVFGLQWYNSSVSPNGFFPEYFKQVGNNRVPVSASQVPAETQLKSKEFAPPSTGSPYWSPTTGAWGNPGPTLGPFRVTLADGSMVTYYWYRFIDQPSFQQYDWSDAEKPKLQSFVEKIHSNWPIDRDYMPPPSSGTLATLDPALIVMPPSGLEVGYVPIVTRQEQAPLSVLNKPHNTAAKSRLAPTQVVSQEFLVAAEHRGEFIEKLVKIEN